MFAQCCQHKIAVMSESMQSVSFQTCVNKIMGKQLVWDVTVVDALAPSRLNQGSLCNPGTTATEAEARKIDVTSS